MSERSPGAAPRVAAVVLHYDRPAGALACVDSLLASTYGDFQLAVVDNGSSPGSLAELEAGLVARPRVALVRVVPNRGYTGGMNAAFAHALATGAEYVWLLADDVRVAPDAMGALVAALGDRPRAGVAAALTYFADDPTRIWYAGGFVRPYTLGRARHRGLGEEDRGQYATPDVVDYANGSSLFARREVVAKIGGLDEVYFTYWEDSDWCQRAAEAGWQTLFVPAARVWHHVTPDTGDKLDRARLYDARNRMLWHARHRPRRLVPVLLWTLAAVPVFALVGRAREGWLQARGLFAYLAGSRGRMDV
ncbi:MAG TPA: glycosyltransferase family 2 protein [Candidatus Eisenbacteria bacterium]|jgi:GT2 family glycosyltransferase